MISFEGLLKLMEMRKLGKPLPKGWKEEVKEYFDWKIKAFDKYANNQTEWVEQLEKALKIAKYLGFDITEYEVQFNSIKMKLASSYE
jgi:ABC-type taurine transport system substrate-binding protein